MRKFFAKAMEWVNSETWTGHEKKIISIKQYPSWATPYSPIVMSLGKDLYPHAVAIATGMITNIRAQLCQVIPRFPSQRGTSNSQLWSSCQCQLGALACGYPGKRVLYSQRVKNDAKPHGILDIHLHSRKSLPETLAWLIHVSTKTFKPIGTWGLAQWPAAGPHPGSPQPPQWNEHFAVTPYGMRNSIKIWHLGDSLDMSSLPPCRTSSYSSSGCCALVSSTGQVLEQREKILGCSQPSCAEAECLWRWIHGQPLCLQRVEPSTLLAELLCV